MSGGATRAVPYSRAERVGRQVAQELSQLLLTEIRDPALANLSITRVRMSSDLRLARVYYSQMGDDEAREKAAQGMERAKGFLRHTIGAHLKLRYTPELHFYYDPSLAEAQRIDELLRTEKSQEGAA